VKKNEKSERKLYTLYLVDYCWEYVYCNVLHDVKDMHVSEIEYSMLTIILAEEHVNNNNQ
jgi:hypothetical protein